MRPYFFLPDSPYRNEWWRYVLTMLLVFSGMFGLGLLPLQIAAGMRGIATGDADGVSAAELEQAFTPNEFLTFQLFPFVIGFAMLLVAFRFNHHRPVRLYFSRRGKIDFRRFGFAFLLFAVFDVLLLLAELIMNGTSELSWNYRPESFFMLLAICIFLLPIQTGFEELLCRSYILKWTGRATRKGIVVILVNGIVFGMLHSMNPEIALLGWPAWVFYIVSGIFAALITVMDDGIELSWGFHTANNFIGIALISNDWQAMRSDSLLLNTGKPDILVTLFVTALVSYPLMIFIFARRYRWKGWKRRLFGKAE